MAIYGPYTVTVFNQPENCLRIVSRDSIFMINKRTDFTQYVTNYRMKKNKHGESKKNRLKNAKNDMKYH